MGWFKNLFKKAIECRGGGCTAIIDVEFERPKGTPECQILRCPYCMTLNLSAHDFSDKGRMNLVNAVQVVVDMDDAYRAKTGQVLSDEQLQAAWFEVCMTEGLDLDLER